jgi:hypothetical protein
MALFVRFAQRRSLLEDGDRPAMGDNGHAQTLRYQACKSIQGE